MKKGTGARNEAFIREDFNSGALEAALRYEVPDTEIRFDKTSLALYTTDASNYRQVPIGIVIPKTREAVIKAIAVCRRHGAPIVSRGGGTGLCGQTCNVAVVIDHSKYLNRILEIDPYRKVARVEPGCILDHLRDETEKYHLTYGPDPATHDHNTFGGMIGNNSCGIHSVMAGRTADNVHELEIVTYDGVRMKVGPTTEEELAQIIADGGRRGEIYAGLKSIRDRYGDLIRKRYPKIPRRVSGYNLDDLLPENGFNVARALVGTESTCITVLEATVRLVHSPPGRALLVIGYPDVYQAGDDIPEIMKFRPVGLEGLDDNLVHFMIKKHLHPEDAQLLPEGKGWLLVEFGADDRNKAAEQARRAMEALKQRENPPAMKLFDDDKDEKKVWEVRESGLGATANVPGMPLGWPGWEDAAVDPAQVGNYLREFKKLLDGHGLIAALYGHFGQGCIHCRISFDLFSHEGIQNYLAFLEKASDLVVKYNGSFSAEHGDGQSKAIFLPKIYGPELMGAFREFKALWDPEWKMNPGKVIDPYRPEENLRLGVDFNPWQPETRFRFPNDHGSFPDATLRCVGVGRCRRTHDAFMCPSFLVTREEKDTTRGRAHLLFEMFRGDLITDGWRSKEVLEALEYCLSCKGCKTDCPVNVDMATYKEEFLHHHYEHRLHPRNAYAMGFIGFVAPLAMKMPNVVNFFTQTPVIRNLVKFIGGTAAERPLPRFASATFSAWFRNRQPPNPEGARVLLYPDIFNDSIYPSALQAAALVLEHWGFRVELPKENPPALRPLLHYGFLDFGTKQLKEAIELLAPFVREGIPVIVLEPSTASVLRDDIESLLPQHRDGQRVSKNTFLFSEFVEGRNLPLPLLQGKAVYHAHCHQKAVLNAEAGKKVLEQMGVEFEEPQPGCCGMAGSFGFERGKYEMSMKIGELNLFPAVRKAEAGTWIVADGFSCRTQIMDGTSRQALHLAELLYRAFFGTSPPGVV